MKISYKNARSVCYSEVFLSTVENQNFMDYRRDQKSMGSSSSSSSSSSSV